MNRDDITLAEGGVRQNDEVSPPVYDGNRTAPAPSRIRIFAKLATVK